MPRLSAIFGAILIVSGTAAAAPPAYRVTGSIAAPGGGWDYARFDAASGQLFVARADGVTAVSSAGKVRAFGPVARGHAVAPLDRDGLLAVTSGNDDTLKLFALDTGAPRGEVKVGRGPDAAIRNPADGDVLVMNAHGGTVSVVDPRAKRVVRTIALQPGLEFAALDKRGELFVNNEDLNRIDVADPRTGAVSAPIALTGCEGPSGLAYDARTDRLIAACDNGKAAVVDAAHRRLVGLLDIGRGPDAVILDADRRLAFIPCGRDGTLVVIALDAAGGPKVTGAVKTEQGARTGALDPRTGALYLPTARFGPPPQPGKRPAMIPGSFHILIVRPVGKG